MFKLIRISGILEYSWMIYEISFLRNMFCYHVQPLWNNKLTLQIQDVNEFRHIIV